MIIDNLEITEEKKNIIRTIFENKGLVHALKKGEAGDKLIHLCIKKDMEYDDIRKILNYFSIAKE